MRLRNKKTGEILELCCHRDGDFREQYNSLTELNEEWEDYEPVEPHIKDEKVRKFVRDWSETFGVTKVYVAGIGDGKEYIELYAQDNGVTDGRIRISIPTQDGVWIGEEYSVDELYGEEEE